MRKECMDNTVAGLRELADRYPWYDIPLLCEARAGLAIPRRLTIQAIWRTAHIVSDDDRPAQSGGGVLPTASDCTCRANDTMAIIEDFVNFGEYRITPRDDTPEEFMAVAEDDLPPDELLTEELASIYLVQGLTRQAAEIYRRLSLLNPEKSVYFAEIIERAQTAEEAD